MKPTMGSLFAGIGGFDLGFERAGFETVWQVEIDPWCRKVLAKNFPNAERFEDVRTVGAHNLKRVDVICGGFPCQDISYAGLGAGIEGKRSGLWSEYARIISELRPRFVLVENVAALLTRGMGRVVGDLAEIGYDTEWEVVSAADVGAPHLRQRVWILAYPQNDASRANTDCFGSYRAEMHEHRGIELRDEQVCEFRPMGKDVAHSYRARQQEQDAAAVAVAEGFDTWGDDPRRTPPLAHAGLEQWNRWSDWTCGWGREPQEALRDARREGRQEAWMSIPESRLGRVAYGIPAVVDRLRGLGNAVVPQIPEMYARKIAQHLRQS